MWHQRNGLENWVMIAVCAVVTVMAGVSIFETAKLRKCSGRAVSQMYWELANEQKKATNDKSLLGHKMKWMSGTREDTGLCR